MRLIFAFLLFLSIPVDSAGGAAAAPPEVGAPAELGKRALKTLIWGIKNPDSDVKALAAEAFGDVGNPSAKKLLKEKLKERDGFVRVAAAKALWKLGDDSGIEVLQEIISKVPKQANRKFPWLAMKALAQNKVREKAIDALVEIHGVECAGLLQKLKTDPYGKIRDLSASALARLGYRTEAIQFRKALENRNEGVRFAGARALSKICDAPSLGPIRMAMRKETATRIKIALLNAMACIGDTLAMPEILKATDDKNGMVRLAAASALSRIGGPGTLSHIKRIYDTSKDIYVRVAVMPSLLALGEKADLDILRRALKATDPDIKLQVVSAIEAIPEPEAREMLGLCLVDQNPLIRVKAAAQVLKRFQKIQRKKQ